MGNVVKLYYTGRTDTTRWELLPNKLLIVEHIEDYLATKTPLTINNFQYVKNELEIGINVDLSQTYSQPLTTSSFKYVSVQNDKELIHYYYVKKVIWRSKSAVRLELVMDVLNTFKEGTDYVFKANTKINREHKSRYIAKAITFHMEYENEGTNGTIAVGDNVRLKDAYGNIVFYFKITALADDSVDGSISNYTTLEDIIDALEEAKKYGLHMSISKNASNYRDILLGDIDWDFDIYRNIDKTPEDINPLLVCDNTLAEKLEHNTKKLQGDWYLLYRNQNTPSESLVNPVECYLIPGESGLEVDAGSVVGGKILPSWLEYGKFYYFMVNGVKTFTLANGTTISDSDASHKTTMVISKVDERKISVQVVRAIYNSTVQVIGNYISEYITANTVPCEYNEDTTFWATNYTNYYTDITYPNTFDNTGSYNVLDDITQVDRTDAKNIKLIKLPYCPYDFEVVGGVIQTSLTYDWDVVSLTQANGGMIVCLKLVELNTKLGGTITVNALHQSALNPFEDLRFDSKSHLNPSVETPRIRASYMESKIYSSEFYAPTFYYDSFAFKFDLEKCDLNYFVANYSTNVIKFNITSTINSKFMFTFENYEVWYNTENYSKYLPIARNNEEVLYNVPYINYVRNGYQYDIKNKNISNISNALGVGLSAGSLAVSLALPSAPLKVAGVVGSLVSMAMSVKSAVVSAVQNENSLKQKIAQTQNQSSSVAGSDDVDLMSIYAENRLKYLEYAPRPEVEDLLCDLFFYAGYKSDRMGIPTHNNRVNFDYLECDAVIENVSSIPNDCLEELINSFKNGITYLHRVERYAGNTWDFAQEYENWETWLLED